VGARTEEFYNSGVKEKFGMNRLNTLCMNFKGYDSRKEVIGKSIYGRDTSFNTEVYDKDRVGHGKNKTTAGTGKKAEMRMEKQSKRDTTAMYKSSVGESYANIQRENEKADYLKNLLL